MLKGKVYLQKKKKKTDEESDEEPCGCSIQLQKVKQKLSDWINLLTKQK
jgi:hypothetical protein